MNHEVIIIKSHNNNAPLYREYEQLVDQSLADFSLEEGLDQDELANLIKTAVHNSENIAATKSITMLVAAADYKKFVRMMRQKSKEPPREALW